VLIENERHTGQVAEAPIGKASTVAFDKLRRRRLMVVLGY